MKNLYLSIALLAGVLFMNSCSKDDDGGTTNPGVSALNCASATFSASAFPGVAYTGTATLPYSGGNGIAYAAGSAISSTGVTGLTATLNQGTLQNGSGNLTFAVAGTPSGTGTATFPVSFGGQSCSLALNVAALPAYVGKWNYQYIRDTIYNWAELVYNGNFQVDSVLGPFDLRTSGAYFQFNANNTYTWKTTGTTTYSGSFSTATSNFGYGVTLKLLNGPVTGDTTEVYIYTLSAPNMTLNRFFPSLTAASDTIIYDRYYDLLKQ